MDSILAFKAISNFVSDLAQEFSNVYHPVALYNRLLERTKISNDTIIHKHVELFRSFVVANRDGILEGNFDRFTQSSVSYSDRVFINIIELYRKANKENKEAIHQHLLAISALLDPTSNAKQVLANSMKALAPVSATPLPSPSGGDNESKFITDLISKVETSINPDEMANPMQAVSSIMSSGIFNDLVTSMSDGINSGTLDIGKLMTSMTSVVSSIQPQGAPGQGPPMNMPDIASLLSSLAPPSAK
jgi:hypothetical protein